MTLTPSPRSIHIFSDYNNTYPILSDSNIQKNKFTKIIDTKILFCYNRFNNIRKALTERVVRDESSRENDIWWKSFMRIAYENHSRAVMPKNLLSDQ